MKTNKFKASGPSLGDLLRQIHERNDMNKITTQQIGEAAIRDGKFIVGSIDKYGAVSFSESPALHDTPASARAECKRLAAATAGKTYIFVRLAGAERVIPTPNTLSI